MNSKEVYHVRVTGPGLELEKDVTCEIGDQIVVLALTGRASSTPPAGVGAGKAAVASDQHISAEAAPRGGLPEVSVREFLLEHKPKRNPDRITAIAYYLQDCQGQSTFTKSDVGDMFTAAAEPVPSNLPRDIKWTIRAGWIAERRDQPGTLYITNEGRDVVDAHFPKEAVERTRHPQKPRQRSRTKGDSS